LQRIEKNRKIILFLKNILFCIIAIKDSIPDILVLVVAAEDSSILEISVLLYPPVGEYNTLQPNRMFLSYPTLQYC
jgi:hypothetical protein